MNSRKKWSCALLAAISTGVAYGQTAEPEMADAMRSEGKIYVVVAILSVILIGVVVYLFAIDRKLDALEKKLPGKKG
jgi:hypothetical protein